MNIIMVEPSNCLHIANVYGSAICGTSTLGETRIVGTEQDIGTIGVGVPWCQICDHILEVLDPARKEPS